MFLFIYGWEIIFVEKVQVRIEILFNSSRPLRIRSKDIVILHGWYVLLEDSVGMTEVFLPFDMILQYSSGPSALKFSTKKILKILQFVNTH